MPGWWSNIPLIGATEAVVNHITGDHDAAKDCWKKAGTGFAIGAAATATTVATAGVGTPAALAGVAATAAQCANDARKDE